MVSKIGIHLLSEIDYVFDASSILHMKIVVIVIQFNLS